VLTISLSGALIVKSQTPQTTVTPSNAYGPGSRVETTVSTDEFGRTVTTEKYYDAQNRLREEFIKTRKYDNSGTEETTIQYRENGTMRTWTKIDKNDDGTKKTEHKTYDENGNRTGGYIGVEIKGKYYYYDWDPDVKKYKGYDEVAMIIPGKQSEKNETICFAPGIGVYAAYSYLKGSSYPLGVNLDIGYDITGHIRVAVDASVHRRKDDPFTQTRSFIMIDGQYVFGNREDCDKKLFAGVHVLAGVGSDRSKYSFNGTSRISKDSGPVYGAGIGGVIKIITNTKARVQADVIRAKWGDEWFNNYRISAGVMIPVFKTTF
jgi:hypothetical protein